MPSNVRVNWFPMLLLLLFAGLAGLVAWHRLSGAAPAPALQRPARPAPAAHAPSRGPATPPRPAETPVAHRALTSPSTLGELTRMRGQRQLLEQQVKIRELQKKLDDMNAPAPVAVRKEIDLPALTPPARGDKAPAAPLAVPVPLQRGPMVVSVQGADGRLSATIRTSEGRTVTVQNGAAFGGGTLVVSRRGVSVRRAGKTSQIPFE